jgi:DeoR/GlpR family transcriptional regulator of sugar metabolism
MESMNLPEERRTRIVEILNEEGKVTPLDLSQRLDVSVDTIRRDLIHLEKTGQLTKVHGGALPRSPATAPYLIRKEQNSAAKIQVAIQTAKFIQSGQIVFMDSGTTVEETARQLPADLQATIITHSIPVAAALAHHEQIEVIMPGGLLNTGSMILSGSTALEGLSRIHADICILGVCSLDPDAGITCTDVEETAIKRTLIKNARQVIVPVTADKLGTAAPFGIAAVTAIDVIITEKSVSDQLLEPYQKLGIRIERGGM